MNNCSFVGKLIKDVELRYLNTGTATASFTISVYNPYSKGEFKSDLVNIVAWAKTAEICADKLRKGSQVAITARYSPRSYDNNEGRKIHIHEFTATDVRFLDRPNTATTESPDSAQYAEPVDISEDSLPF